MNVSKGTKELPITVSDVSPVVCHDSSRCKFYSSYSNNCEDQSDSTCYTPLPIEEACSSDQGAGLEISVEISI